MPLATLHSLTFVGVRPVPVQIEVHLSAGLPSFERQANGDAAGSEMLVIAKAMLAGQP